MTQYLYLFQDIVSGNFGKPFFAPNVDSVRREFLTLASDPSVPDYVFQDGVCLEFGTFNFDPVNPKFDFYDVPKIVLRGMDNEVMALRRAACPTPDGDSI